MSWLGMSGYSTSAIRTHKGTPNLHTIRKILACGGCEVVQTVLYLMVLAGVLSDPVGVGSMEVHASFDHDDLHSILFRLIAICCCAVVGY